MFGSAMELLSAWPEEGAMTRYEALSRELESTGAPDLMRAHFDWQVGARLRGLGDAEATRRFLSSRAALYAPPNDALANIVRLEAILAREQGDWTAAQDLLARSRAALTALDEKAAPYALQAQAAWHDAQFAQFNEMGMLDAAAAEVTVQKDLAARSKDEVAIANAFMNRATLAVSQEDWDALDDMLAEANAGRIDLDAREFARLRLRHAVCTAEGEREGRRPAGGSVGHLRALLDDPKTPADVALEARANLATILFDRGQTRESLAELASAERALEQETVPSPSRRGRAVTLAALAARHALSATDGVASVATLEALRARLRVQFAEQIERWRRAPPETSGIGYLHFGDGYLLANELMRIELELARRAEPNAGAAAGARTALDVPLRLHSVGSLVRGTPARELDVATIERSLTSPEGGFLLYFPGRARSLVFALDATGAYAFELESWLKLELARRDLESATLQAARSGTTADEDRARKVAERLAGFLFPAELARRVEGWRSVCVLGTDLTGWIPFELLRPTTTARELGTTHAVSYLPSLHWGVFLDGRATNPIDERGPELVLATADRLPSELAARWDVVDFDARTVEPVIDAWGDRVRHVATATFDDVRASVMGARVAQIVAHGVYDAHRRRPAGILFSGAATVAREAWAEDLETVPWPEIVVLDTCGSQRMQLRRGDDGRAGLGGALLAGGARCVLLSYTDVELRASMALTAAFGRALRAGRSPDEALRFARGAPGVGFQGHLVHALGRADRPVARHAQLAGEFDAHDEARAKGSWNSVRTSALLLGAAVVVVLAAWSLRRRSRAA